MVQVGIAVVVALTVAWAKPAHLDHTGMKSAALRTILAAYDPLPLDTEVAQVYGQLVATLRRTGRVERSRKADVMIAATAVRHALPLYTLNAKDLRGLESQVQVVDLGP